MTKPRKKWRVVVRSTGTDEGYEHVIGEGLSERQAEKVEAGANINLDHDRYSVDMEEEE